VSADRDHALGARRTLRAVSTIAQMIARHNWAGIVTSRASDPLGLGPCQAGKRVGHLPRGLQPPGLEPNILDGDAFDIELEVAHGAFDGGVEAVGGDLG
jgi:hypothetical protein